MKRLFFLAVLIIGAAAFKGGNLIAQEGFMAGNVLGIHVMEYELAPGVTDEEVATFLKNKWIPAYEKHFQGVRAVPLRGDRGESKGRVGSVFVFETVALRDKYAPEKDTPSELALVAMEKMKPVEEELSRLVTSWSTTYTDWEVIYSPFRSQGIPVAGNIMAIHTEHYELAPGVTDDEYMEFFIGNMPEYEKIFPDIVLIGLKGIRGDNEGCIGQLLLFESDKVRARYWEGEGTSTDLGIAAMDKMIPLVIQAEKMASSSTTYTDWLVE